MNTTRKLTVLAAACVAACVVAACGSSTSSSSSSSSSAASGGTPAAAAGRSKFVTCLKAHGVTLPAFRGRPGAGAGGAGGGGAAPPGSGTAGGGGTPPPGGFRGGGFGGGFRRFRSNPKMQAAFKACAADLPKGGFRGRFGGGFGGRPQRAAITKFVTCIRKHGYNLPAPNLSGKGPVFPPKIESNAKFQAASRSCRNLLVPQGAGSGAGSSA